MSDTLNAEMEAAVARFKLERVLNQGMSVSQSALCRERFS